MIFKSTDYIEYISENIRIITEILEIKVDYNRVSSETLLITADNCRTYLQN